MASFVTRSAVKDASGRTLDFMATVHTMDKAIRQTLEAQRFETEQAFYNRYVEMHRAKHSEEFEPIYR